MIRRAAVPRAGIHNPVFLHSRARRVDRCLLRVGQRTRAGQCRRVVRRVNPVVRVVRRASLSRVASTRVVRKTPRHAARHPHAARSLGTRAVPKTPQLAVRLPRAVRRVNPSREVATRVVRRTRPPVVRLRRAVRKIRPVVQRPCVARKIRPPVVQPRRAAPRALPPCEAATAVARMLVHRKAIRARATPRTARIHAARRVIPPCEVAMAEGRMPVAHKVTHAVAHPFVAPAVPVAVRSARPVHPRTRRRNFPGPAANPRGPMTARVETPTARALVSIRAEPHATPLVRQQARARAHSPSVRVPTPTQTHARDSAKLPAQVRVVRALAQASVA
ncbi:hypothetical protein GCM10011591_26920 [Nocardia camponoti]|uniref:Uncharacterized protein n=1 Tax=Nocardia camponoti TaxID=1616106 RepID=A0A917QKQ6_9NOCA|nr:hypothetical protein GCM10011591_26920 [Nocardia camponoti]